MLDPVSKILMSKLLTENERIILAIQKIAAEQQRQLILDMRTIMFCACLLALTLTNFYILFFNFKRSQRLEELENDSKT